MSFHLVNPKMHYFNDYSAPQPDSAEYPEAGSSPPDDEALGESEPRAARSSKTVSLRLSNKKKTVR